MSRHQFKEVVLALGKRGTTILFSSHILSDVQDVADRIGILNHGRIRQVGTLNELKTRMSIPKTIEVLLTQPSDKWQELESLRNVKSVELVSTERILANLYASADADEVINTLIQKIVELGIRVRGVTLLSPSLDEIYLKHVQEGDNA